MINTQTIGLFFKAIKKKALVFLLIMGLTLFIGDFSDVSAQDRRNRKSAKNAFEFSLMGLKESAKKIENRNKWLKSEIKKNYSVLDRLEKEEKALNKRKNQLTNASYKIDNTEDKLADLTVTEDDMKQMREEIQQLNSVYIDLNTRLQLKKREEEQLRKQISKVQSSVNQLKDSILSLEVFEKHKALNAHQELAELIKSSEKNVRNLEKNLSQIEQKAAKSLKVFQLIQEKNNYLKQQASIYQDEMRVVLEEEKKINEEIKTIKRKNDDQLSDLALVKSKLNIRRKELMRVLTKINKKMEQKRQFFDQDEQEEVQLEDNLAIIRRENSSLKEEIASLEGKLKKLSEN